MTIALHVHNVQTIHKSENKNYETRKLIVNAWRTWNICV